jgi:ADP-ribose pyrophosphatase
LTTERKSIYKGKLVDLGIETTVMPDGRPLSLEIVRHPGGAAVVAVDNRLRLCMLRQYRHAAGGWLWELPAGKRDHGEDPLHTAQRELEEEAGRRAASWTKLGSTVTTPGFCDEIIHLYLARHLTEIPQRTEAHELLEVHWIPFKQAQEWIRDGTLVDAKSIIGIHLSLPSLDIAD